ncbi:MAG TPA: restriction endonuclease [Chthonomonadaceae bacterium]|nr:restriction endonuclease [Chthonomonadaceae bacterium]
MTTRRRRTKSPVQRALERLRQRFSISLPPGVAASIPYLLVVIGGIAMALKGARHNIAAGAVLLAIGGAGLVWQAWQWKQAKERAHERDEDREAHDAKRRHRRERNIEIREIQRRRTQTDAAARRRSRDVQELARRVETDRTTAERAYRRGREEAIARDAMRLLTMSEMTLLDAAAEAFDTRGFIVSREDEDSRRDLLLRGDEGEVRIVARLAQVARRADTPEVDELEQLRSEVGAAAGILIGIAGFTPEAVRRATALPITLADAHVLAQWRVGGSLDGAPPPDLAARTTGAEDEEDEDD